MRLWRSTASVRVIGRCGLCVEQEVPVLRHVRVLVAGRVGHVVPSNARSLKRRVGMKRVPKEEIAWLESITT